MTYVYDCVCVCVPLYSKKVMEKSTPIGLNSHCFAANLVQMPTMS